jgi:molybdopterin-guanine dinucleotide biosynthesis protein A
MLSAAILAGGKATRFAGIDKSTLIVAGRSIFERQLAELLQLTNDILLVGGRFRHPRVRAVPDRIPGSGPLAGLHAALTEARNPTIVAVACDMPYISARLLAYLVELEDDWDAVVPRTDRGVHPLCAVYTRRCLAAVTSRLDDRRLSLIELLTDLRVRYVDLTKLDRFGDCEHLVANLNTPSDYYSNVGALRRHEP